MARDGVLELRQYMLKPGRRDRLVDLFARAFIAGHEERGMAILGTFADRDDESRYIWLRGFPAMAERAERLASFYGDAVWKDNREIANGTMISSDDVLLLRPSFRDRFRLPAGRLRRPEAAALAELHILNLDQPVDDAVRDHFEQRIVRAAEASGLKIVGCYETEPSANTFPALPVREEESVLVWMAEPDTMREAGPPGTGGEMNAADVSTPYTLTGPTVRRLRGVADSAAHREPTA